MATSGNGKRTRRSSTTKRSATATKERKAPGSVAKRDGGSAPKLSAREASQLAAESFESAVETLHEVARRPAELGPLGIGEAATTSDVSSRLDSGGVAFGDFAKSVGLAVAEAQTALDKNMRETAQALSDTKINTVAVFEQVINDEDGSMAEGKVHVQELPLTNYVMPTVYQWSRVYLQADMNVQDFNARSGFNIQQSSMNVGANFQANAGTFGWGASGGASFNYGKSSTGVDTSASTSMAAGTLHMEATLEPRHDIELPKPYIITKGPKLALHVSGRTPLTETKGDPAVTTTTGQQVKIKAVLTTQKEGLNKAKALDVAISDPGLTYSLSNNGVTDDTGTIEITITRGGNGIPYDATKPPADATVRVAFGLVSQAVVVTL